MTIEISPKCKEILKEKFTNKEIEENINLLYFSPLENLALDQKQFTDFIKRSYEKRYNFEYAKELNQSTQVKKIQKEILDSIRKRATLNITKKTLQQFHPTKDLNEIQRRQSLIQKAKHFFLQFSPEKVDLIREKLQQEERKTNPLNDVIYLCDEDEIFKAVKNKIPADFPLFMLPQMHQFRKYQDASHIRYLYTVDSKFASELEQHSNVEAVAFQKSFFAMFPELFIKEFEKNLSFFQAAAQIAELTNTKSIDFDELKEITGAITEIILSEKQEFDEETLELFLAEAQEIFEHKLASCNINGMDLLKILQAPRSNTLIDKHLLETEIEMRKKNEEMVSFLDFSAYPLVLKKDKVELLRKEKESSSLKRHYAQLDKFHLQNKEKLILIKQVKLFLEEIDLLLTLGQSFARHNPPKVTNNKKQFFNLKNIKSRSLTESNIDVVPINYHLDRAQTIITGANSGGKTSLLNLITETHLLAMMGLFVEGEAEIALYDEIHYFKKSSGTVGCGAFETTLRSFAAFGENKTKRILLLADEIESITEPGAASKILSATLSWITKQSPVDIVLVTHLGEELAKECKEARIDGIEAERLNEKLELVVNRNPKINVLAKSTPQLIVERLAKKYTSPYFSYLLKEMRT